MNKRIHTILYFFSPFTITIFLSFIIPQLYSSYQSDTAHFSRGFASLFLPAFIVLGPGAIFIRYFVKEKVGLIWLIETMIALPVIVFWFI